MTDYTWPATICPAASEWRLISNAGTFGQRVIARGGDRWACTLTMPVLRRDDAYTLRAFVAKLRGTANRAVLPNHAFLRRGALTTDLSVAGADQDGSTLICDGATPSVTDAVMAGDFVTIEGRLYMVAEDADSDGGGNVTLELTHPLASSPADNATIEVQNPTGRFIFMGQAGWSHHPLRMSIFDSLEFMEDVP